MRIWIDLANSPHVLFFAPLIRQMKEQGHAVLVTARVLAQTVELAELYGLKTRVIGVHGGRGTGSKAVSILSRAMNLRDALRGEAIDLAVSHNSYAHAVAARMLRVPFVTLMDYEHTPANHVSFRLARRVIVPDSIPAGAVRKYGVTSGKYVSYAGFKEQVYLGESSPNSDLQLELTRPGDRVDDHVIVVARPPADFALYHRFENPLFYTWLVQASSHKNVVLIVLPRNESQRNELEMLGIDSLVIPSETLYGPSLIEAADLVVSAGGTMNREAAVLGIPAYSLFKGRPAAVDLALQEMGRMTLIDGEAGLGLIRLEKKPTPEPLHNPNLKIDILDAILG